MATALYNQTILFYNQTNGLTLLCFYSTWTERVSAICYSRDGEACSYSNSMVQSKAKVDKILSQARDIQWDRIVFCFGVILGFS